MIIHLCKYILVNFLIINFIFGEFVNINKAMTVSSNLIKERFPIQIRYEIETITLDRDEYFYIVNLNPRGFIIVAANDIVRSILGYSFNENLVKIYRFS